MKTGTKILIGLGLAGAAAFAASSASASGGGSGGGGSGGGSGGGGGGSGGGGSGGSTGLLPGVHNVALNTKYRLILADKSAEPWDTKTTTITWTPKGWDSPFAAVPGGALLYASEEGGKALSIQVKEVGVVKIKRHQSELEPWKTPTWVLDASEGLAEVGGDEPAIWMPEPYAQYNYGSAPGSDPFAPLLYTIDFTAFPSGPIGWRVWEAKANPANEEERDAFKLGSGMVDTEDEARVAAEAFVDALLKPKGHPLPPKPKPDASTVEPAIKRHGLRLKNDQIEVTSPATWVAWAEPYLRAHVKSTEGVALARGLIGEAFPELARPIRLEQLRIASSGPQKPTMLELLKPVEAKYLAGARLGQAWAAMDGDEPLRLERAAAELVGAQAPRSDAPAFAFQGYEVRVAKKQGNLWTWQAWRRGWSDTPPNLKGIGLGQRLAIRNAKVKIRG